MTVSGILALGRERSMKRLTETVQFYRPGAMVEDPVTFQPIESEEPIGEPIIARVKSSNTQPREVTTAGQQPAADRLEVHVQVGSIDVGKGVMIRVLASSEDPGLVGNKYRTMFAAGKGQVTVWRYPVEQVL